MHSSSDESLTSSEEDSSEEDTRHVSRRSKKKSKKLKHRKSKDKKSKKKKHKRRRSSSSESSSSCTAEEEWVVKEVVTASQQKQPGSDVVDDKNTAVPPGPKATRDEWMTMGSCIPTFSNDSKRTKRQKEKEEAREKSSIDQLGQSAVELNPYWKGGGTGLPSEDPSATNLSKSSSTTVKAVGDGGISWLRKAFLRAKEQAIEEGKSLEEIAADRWGSLENFYKMLEDAEEKAKQSSHQHSGRDSRRNDRDFRSNRRQERFQRPRDDDDNSDDDHDNHRRHHSSHSSSPHSNYKSSYSRSRDRSRDRDSRRSYTQESSSSSFSRSQTSSSSGGWRKPSHTASTSKSNSPERKVQKLISDERPEKTQTQVRVPVAEEVEDEAKEEEDIKVLTDTEMNQLCAKIMKAEMMGDQTLVESLKAQKAAAEKIKKEVGERGGVEKKKVVVKVILDQNAGAGPRRKVREKPGETHSKDGQRVRYFPDDDKQSLQNMFEKEKRNTVEDENALFSRLAGKGIKANEDYDMDDIFTDKASSSKQEMKEKEQEVRDVLHADKVYKKTLENCSWCFDGNKLQKNLVISIGEKSILCLPPYQSLTEGHCLILPMDHISCATELDEDVWEEMQKFRKALVSMFIELEQDVVIFETALFLKKSPHMYLECVPMPKETGELAPIYFKKAIQECETEWAQNKKLVDLRNRDVRRAVPKGLPYFSVDFGNDSGFAHVVEDERNFPRNFAQEIIGGMMELDHSLWRKQKQDDFKTQRNKVMNFLKTWGPHDWTR